MTTPTADRYVLAGLGEKVIAFPDYYVLDVLVVDRNYVMRLRDAILVGCSSRVNRSEAARIP